MVINRFSTYYAVLFLCGIIVPCKCHLDNEDKHVDDDGNKTDKDEVEVPVKPFRYVLSSLYLTHLAMTEEEVVEDIKNYVASLKERLHLAEAYLKDYEDSTIKGTKHLPEGDSLQKAEEVSSNPLLSYRMVRRFSHEFDALGAHVNQYLEPKLVNRVTELGRFHGFPGNQDYTDALNALLRLHYVYDLDTNDLVRGKIQDVDTNVGLTTSQCHSIAKYAMDNGFYTLALDWIYTTELKIDEDNDDSVSPSSVAETYKTLIELHDRDYDKDVYNLFMFTEKLSFNPNSFSLKDDSLEEYVGDRSNSGDSAHYNFLAQCNGEDLMTEEEKSKLYCWYERKRNPYFILFPLKMELLFIEPELVQIYDIVNDKWIKDMIQTAKPTLERAPNSITDTRRTAIYTYLADEDIPNTPIARRIELLFDLKVRGINASENLQIASYAFGAHVGNHVDSLGSGNATEDKSHPVISWKGDRTSTFLIYLNDVNRGGLTAFPLLGAVAYPVKGSAVHWYDSLRNGEIDTRMLHAACPIVLGHKWIATKWTHANENFLKRPCTLDEFS